MSLTHKFKVGLVQMRMGADSEPNFAAAVKHVREAARLGAHIVCLPELFRAQYFCQREDIRLFDLAEAIPADKDTYGYLSEHHSFGETEEQAGEYAEELAAEMLATTLDVDFDPDTSWDEKKEIYRISNKIVRTSNVTQSAVGDKHGLWTTTIAAAVFIFDED